jgi:hypothetical protein
MPSARDMVCWVGTALLLQCLLTACTGHVRQPIGEVSHMRGNIFVGRDGLSRPRLLTLHEPIYPDDVLVSEGASVVTLLVENLSLTLGPNTRLIIGTRNWVRFAVALERGTVRTLAQPMDTVVQPHIEVRLDATTVVRAYSDILLWSDEQPTGLGSHAAGSIASFGVVNLGRSGPVELDTEGQSLPIMPQQFSVAVPGHSPIPAVPLSVASAGFMAAIQPSNLEPSKPESIKKLSKPVRRYAKQDCKRHDSKTGVIKTPRRNGYEDLAKCL